MSREALPVKIVTIMLDPARDDPLVWVWSEVRNVEIRPEIVDVAEEIAGSWTFYGESTVTGMSLSIPAAPVTMIVARDLRAVLDAVLVPGWTP